MNYQQTIDYLFSQLPMFHRVGAPAYKANLDNTIRLCQVMGNPEKKFRAIHIAGTNGKGSVSHLVASVLQTAGYKTGLFTSPHLKDFRERIRINGKKIPKSKITDFVSRYKKSFDSFQPSFFEYTFGMAAEYFANEKVDIAVIETGMGGRLDSTNVVNSLISVITNIGWDHTQFLGDTLSKIAAEKAGIIKPGVPVIIGQTQQEVIDVFKTEAKKNKSELFFAEDHFKIAEFRKIAKPSPVIKLDITDKNGKLCIEKLACPLTGNYQLKNIITVLQVLEVMKSIGFTITNDHIFQGFRNVIKNTGLQGRWQKLGENPLVICDTGHNIDGMKEVVAQLNEIRFRQLHFIAGFVKDKAIDEILQVLPCKAVYYFCKANIPRGLNQDELMHKAKMYGLKGKSYQSVAEAYHAARTKAALDDLIFVGGSTFVVAEVL